MAASDLDLGAALHALGLPDTPDMRKQLETFRLALEIYGEREAEHHGLWKQTGIHDAVHNAAHKTARLRAWAERGGLESGEISRVPGDSALDGINYLAFSFRFIADLV